MCKSINLLYQEETPTGVKKPKGAQIVFDKGGGIKKENDSKNEKNFRKGSPQNNTDTGSNQICELLTHLASASNLVSALAMNKLK